MKRFKKILIYFLLGLLVLRCVFWLSNPQLERDRHKLDSEANDLIHRADSVRLLRTTIQDSVIIEDLKKEEEQLLWNALTKAISARDRLDDQLLLVNTLSWMADLLFGLVVASYIILSIKKQ